MVQRTKIEWATHTSNPIKYRDRATGRSVWACVRRSPGCAKCYSADLAKRYGRGGAFTAEELAGYECYLDDRELRQLLRPKRLPAGSKVFVGDMTDVFGEWVPFEYLDRLFAVFALRPDVVFQVLTKRPERMREYMDGYPHYRDRWAPERVQKVMRDMIPWEPGTPGSLGLPQKHYTWPGWPLPNVWLGTSVENQHWADIRLPELLATPAAVRFVSYEPALGPVDFRLDEEELTGGLNDESRKTRVGPNGLHWIIVGGESGPKARPFDIEWARSTVRQCREAGVACFVKQLGSNPVTACSTHGVACGGHKWPWNENEAQARGKEPRPKLKSRKGSDMAEWPEDLRVREMPR